MEEEEKVLDKEINHWGCSVHKRSTFTDESIGDTNEVLAEDFNLKVLLRNYNSTSHSHMPHNILNTEPALASQTKIYKEMRNMDKKKKSSSSTQVVGVAVDGERKNKFIRNMKIKSHDLKLHRLYTKMESMESGRPPLSPGSDMKRTFGGCMKSQMSAPQSISHKLVVSQFQQEPYEHNINTINNINERIRSRSYKMNKSTSPNRMQNNLGMNERSHSRPLISRSSMLSTQLDPPSFLRGWREETTPLKEYLRRLNRIETKYKDLLIKLSVEEAAIIKHRASKRQIIIPGGALFSTSLQNQEIIVGANHVELREEHECTSTLKALSEIEEDYKITKNLISQQKVMEEEDALNQYKTDFHLKTGDFMLKEEENEDDMGVTGQVQ